MAHILIIDDEPNMRWVLQEALHGAGHVVRAAESGEAGVQALGAEATELVLLDLKLKGMDGLSTLRTIRTRWPDLVVLILTAYGTVTSAVEALQAGASDYLRKPFDVEELRFKVGRALERRNLYRELEQLRATPPPALIGTDPAWLRAQTQALQAVTHGLDLVLIGEASSGRSRIAQATHQASHRRSAPLIMFDLGMLPPDAQAAAFEQPNGLWAQAGQGSLVLRQIEQCSPAGAAALQRLIVQRSTQLHGPLIIATAQTAEQALAILPRAAHVSVPPLRTRPDDLVAYWRHWAPTQRLSAAAEALLAAYPWPGNLGELRSVIERATLLAAEDTILPAHLPERLHADPAQSNFRLPHHGINLEQLEADLIRQALARTNGNKSRAAELLGLTRHTLLYRLEKYDIRVQ